jgi:hypothetical protein
VFAKPQAASNKCAPGQPAPQAVEKQDTQAPVPEITFTGTYDTAFYAHYFLTGDREKDAEVKCNYAQAHTCDPLTQKEDCWVSVNYNSKYDGVRMRTNTSGRSSNKPALNLVVALDISGSMHDTFRGDDSDKDESSGASGRPEEAAGRQGVPAHALGSAA